MFALFSVAEKQDEPTRFEQLYLTYRRVMFSAANSVLRDPQLAEDAVQQAFMRVMDHMEKVSEVICPQTKSFMVIIVRNIAINMYNERKRKTVVSFDELSENSPGTVAVAAARDNIAEHVDAAALAQTLAKLPQSYRDVLLLKFDNGYSTAEIAALLSVSEENVKKRIQRARNKLGELLLSEEEFA